MNKVEAAFLKSHIKKAIWYLECANKLKSNCIDSKLIDELKFKLLELKIEEKIVL